MGSGEPHFLLIQVINSEKQQTLLQWGRLETELPTFSVAEEKEVGSSD